MTVADPAVDTPRTRAENVRSRRGHIRQPAERAPRGPSRSAARNRRPRRVWELAIPAEVGKSAQAQDSVAAAENLTVGRGRPPDAPPA